MEIKQYLMSKCLIDLRFLERTFTICVDNLFFAMYLGDKIRYGEIGRAGLGDFIRVQDFMA